MHFTPNIKLMGFVSYPHPWLHFKRNVNEYILYFIKSGELHIQENGIPYVLKKGDLLLLEPNLDHSGIQEHICDYYYIHFEHSDIQNVKTEDPLSVAQRYLIEQEPEQPREDSQACYFPKTCTLSKKGFHQALHSMNEMLQLYKRKNFNRMLTALKFSEFLIDVSRDHFLSELQEPGNSRTKSYIKVHDLLDYIHEHYPSKITSAEIEQQFECNYDYINRVFTRLTGDPIMRYVNKVRINHARELIEATHLSFYEIGYLTGLNDPFYFSKVFKKYVGMSPKQYYKTIREDH
nr:AraC family transcriptional regulator [Paenibacillus caui]